MATENGGGGAGVESPLPPTARAKPDYYGILGVEKDCTEAQLKKAYKKMSLKLHPDKNQDDPDAQHKFAILSEAYTCLLDPVKRIDYNKEIAEGGTVGWGWNAETARKRAADYKWNGDDMVFNMGAQLNQARQFRDFRHQRFATQFGKFWGASVLLIALFETLIVVTALEVGIPTAFAIWGPILAVLLIGGVLLSIRTDDWEFPPGALVAVVAVVAFVGAGGGADLLVQAKAFRFNQVSGVDAGALPVTHAGIYNWADGVSVDVARTVSAGKVCVAPIIPASLKGSANYSLTTVGYWAMDEGCCSAGAPTCEGWGEEWKHAINWNVPERPSSLTLSTSPPLPAQEVYEAIASVSGGSAVVSVVALEWSADAEAVISRMFEQPAWLWLVLVGVTWPAILSLAWTLLTFGSCFFFPRLHCHQPLESWCLYVGSGCPACWSEMELLDD